MNLQDFTNFLKLPIAKLVVGFFFGVLMAQGFAIYTVYNESAVLKQEIINCEKAENVKITELEKEIKSELRNIIKSQEIEIAKNQQQEEEAKKQQELALQNKRKIEKIKHEFRM